MKHRLKKIVVILALIALLMTALAPAFLY